MTSVSARVFWERGEASLLGVGLAPRVGVGVELSDAGEGEPATTSGGRGRAVTIFVTRHVG
jgi:hypothetical protein